MGRSGRATCTGLSVTRWVHQGFVIIHTYYTSGCRLLDGCCHGIVHLAAFASRMFEEAWIHSRACSLAPSVLRVAPSQVQLRFHPSFHRCQLFGASRYSVRFSIKRSTFVFLQVTGMCCCHVGLCRRSLLPLRTSVQSYF